jgi:hypothetical protein
MIGYAPGSSTHRGERQDLMHIRGYLVVLTLVLTAAGAEAQLGFTEFALSDSTLNSSPTTDFWIASAAPADADADGDLDLLVAGYYVVYWTPEDPGSVEDKLTLYRNDGPLDESTWTFTPVPVDAGGLSFTAADLAWGDYDGDGDADVAVAATGALALWSCPASPDSFDLTVTRLLDCTSFRS